MKKNITKILSIAVLINSVAVQASVNSSSRKVVAEKGVATSRQFQVNPQDPKRQFSAYCAYISRLADDDAKTAQWLSGNGKVAQNSRGGFSITFRSDPLKQSVTRFVQAVSPLIISVCNIKWQIGPDETRALIRCLKKVINGYGVTL